MVRVQFCKLADTEMDRAQRIIGAWGEFISRFILYPVVRDAEAVVLAGRRALL